MNCWCCWGQPGMSEHQQRPMLGVARVTCVRKRNCAAHASHSQLPKPVPAEWGCLPALLLLVEQQEEVGVGPAECYRSSCRQSGHICACC